ncbi:MAG: hypothetical protein KH230_16875 [Enterocloster asparagiformis]|nr:hypothetical protein [Enterocloster asparagiformis]
MKLPKECFDILYYIEKHPFISCGALTTHFSKKYRLKPTFPFFSLSKNIFLMNFLDTIEYLKNNDFIEYTCSDSFAKNELDKLQRYPKSETISSFTDYRAVHLVSSKIGSAYIDEYLHNRRLFWIPWLVTSLIALAGIIK